MAEFYMFSLLEMMPKLSILLWFIHFILSRKNVSVTDWVLCLAFHGTDFSL